VLPQARLPNQGAPCNLPVSRGGQHGEETKDEDEISGE
jgi:hypothetical protein